MMVIRIVLERLTSSVRSALLSSIVEFPAGAPSRSGLFGCVCSSPSSSSSSSLSLIVQAIDRSGVTGGERSDGGTVAGLGIGDPWKVAGRNGGAVVDGSDGATSELWMETSGSPGPSDSLRRGVP